MIEVEAACLKPRAPPPEPGFNGATSMIEVEALLAIDDLGQESASTGPPR